MQNVRLIISLTLITHAIVIGSQYQVLDVCIQVKLDQSFRKGSISAQELEKYGRFGNIDALPFDKYFRIASDLYDDDVETNELVEIKKNLIRHVPLMIKNNIPSLSHDNQSAVLKKYKFPKFLPQNFIKKQEDSQNNYLPFQHVVYKNKKNGSTKTLALRYWIGDAAERGKLPKFLAIPVCNAPQSEDKQLVSSCDDQVIDLLHFLSLFIWPTVE